MKEFKIIYENRAEEVSALTFNEAIDLALGVSKNIEDNIATVVTIDETQETAEVNIYKDYDFYEKEIIQIIKI